MNPLTEFAAQVGWSANLLAVVILACLSLFGAAYLLARAWQEVDDLIANQPPPDAPNYDGEAYPDGLPSLRVVAEHVVTVGLPPGDYLAAIYDDGSVEMVSVDDLARLPEVSER